MFFVASAPLSSQGHINCSPKGADSFRILDEHMVCYLDLTGSGAETIAHLKENGRIVIMFCAFDGPPRIVRFHGQGIVITEFSDEFTKFRKLFGSLEGVRAIITVKVTRVSSSCGFSVPLFDFKDHRDTLDKWAQRKGEEALKEYRQKNNSLSIDGLPGFSEK